MALNANSEINTFDLLRFILFYVYMCAHCEPLSSMIIPKESRREQRISWSHKHYESPLHECWEANLVL